MLYAFAKRRLASLPAFGLAMAALAAPGIAHAQIGPPISSGSGAGTGTGQEAGSGLGTTGSGIEAGSGLGTTGTGMESAASSGPYLRVRPYGRVPGGILDPGTGSRVDLPDDLLPPTDAMGGLGAQSFGANMSAADVSALFDRMMKENTTLGEPGQRAMAFERMARSAIFNNQLELAYNALEQARTAALAEPMRLVRDQRLMATIVSLLSLAEAEVREGLTDDSLQVDTTRRQGERTARERTYWLDRSEVAWERASELALQLTNVNYRTQTLHQVVDSQAGGSELIANQVNRLNYGGSNGRGGSQHLQVAADRDLVLAAAHARGIERPVWRDRALVLVAAHAAVSNQFARGLQVAQTVPQPETRTDGLLRISEAEARQNAEMHIGFALPLEQSEVDFKGSAEHAAATLKLIQELASKTPQDSRQLDSLYLQAEALAPEVARLTGGLAQDLDDIISKTAQLEQQFRHDLAVSKLAPAFKPRVGQLESMVKNCQTVLDRAPALSAQLEQIRTKTAADLKEADKLTSAGEKHIALLKALPQPSDPAIKKLLAETDAVVKSANAMTDGMNQLATMSYTETSHAVASIPQQDPRTILAGVLIDSLVSVGRFDDARASIVLYPDYSNQILALGAIAESQGARGVGDQARSWIASQAPAEYRPYLYRRVNDGILAAVDRHRSRDLSRDNR